MDRFHFERELWRQGIALVAGVDEVGRGPLAGPVTVAAVMLPAAWDQTSIANCQLPIANWQWGGPAELAGLNDSKQLSASQREAFYGALTTLPGIHFALAECHAGEIDEINILQATHRAMNAALAQLTPAPAYVLVDGTRVPSLKLPHTAIVKGDALSYSIAAASVLAKVTRDRQMVAYHQRWPQYGFATHKGYGTPAHLAALAQHGPCPIHRRSFAPVKSLPIANCQLEIGNWQLAMGNEVPNRQSAIGNPQLAAGLLRPALARASAPRQTRRSGGEKALAAGGAEIPHRQLPQRAGGN